MYVKYMHSKLLFETEIRAEGGGGVVLQQPFRWM